MFKLFKDGNLEVLKSSSSARFCPLLAGAPESQTLCTQIFSTMISVLRKDVILPVESTQSFLDEIVSEALKSQNQAQVTSLSRIIASITNKWKDGNSKELHDK